MSKKSNLKEHTNEFLTHIFKDNGITLVALVVTIVVLLIMAGVTINIVLGNNGVIQRAKDGSTIWANAKNNETAMMEQMESDVSALSQESIGDSIQIDIDKLTVYYRKGPELFWDSTNMRYVDLEPIMDASTSIADVGFGEGYNIIMYNSNTYRVYYNVDPWVVVLNTDVPLEPGHSASGSYFGESVHNAGDMVRGENLEVGDVIKYVYDSGKAPIECEVIYNDSTNGIQIISLDSVRDVTLGITDPLAQNHTTLEGGNDEYYKYQYDEGDARAIWSYNHAIATLNNYAQEYLGPKAISARCIGCPANNIILSEDLSNNYFNGDESITGMIKDGDDNYKGTNHTTYGYVSNDLERLDSLEIVKCSSAYSYWLASRFISGGFSHGNYNGVFGLCSIYQKILLNEHSESDAEAQKNILIAYRNIIPPSGNNKGLTRIFAYPNNGNGFTRGFRPVITLKSNEEFEFLGHAISGPGGFEAVAY